MYKRLIIIFLLLYGNILYPQSIDIKLLRSVYTQEALPSDGFFRFLSDSEVYLVIGTPTAVAAAGFISHDKKTLRNAGVIMASVIVNAAVTNALKAFSY